MSANQKGTVDKAQMPESAPETNEAAIAATTPEAPKESPKKAKLPEFEATKTYTVVGTGTGKGGHLKEGVSYTVSGADAASLIEHGHATLK